MIDDIIIVVDTREQKPYIFEEIKIINQALPAGDYSLAGFELDVAVERKTLSDFVNTVIHDRMRFFEELKKLSEYRHACITVEATLEDIRLRRFTSHAHPESIIGSAFALIVDWQIPVFFNINRQESLDFTKRYLMRASTALARRDKNAHKTKNET